MVLLGADMVQGVIRPLQPLQNLPQNSSDALVPSSFLLLLVRHLLLVAMHLLLVASWELICLQTGNT